MNPVAGLKGATAAGLPVSGKSLPRAPQAQAAATTGAAPEVRQPSLEERIRAAAQLLQEYVQQSGRDMKFTVDADSNRTVVRIFNRATGELVRQVPGEEVLRVAALLRDDLDNGVIDERA